MSHSFSGCGPILCAPLLRQVDCALIELLRSLRPEEWELQTVAPQWKVRDVAAHLLDTALRKLSLVRDGSFVEQAEIFSQQDVIALVNRLNHEGVSVYRRLSPSVLVGLMELACQQSAAFHESLDPLALALLNVSWAGDTTSPNWFDTARELTERWHHQQQIRLATGRPGIMKPELYYPVLDCFLRGLAFQLRQVPTPQNISLVVEIEGDCGGTWTLFKGTAGWKFAPQLNSPPDARVVIPQEIAWRIFTKGIDRIEARALSRFEGDTHLTDQVLGLTAIVG